MLLLSLMDADYLRAITRPVVTIVIAVALSVLAVLASVGYDTPQWFLGFSIPILLWWFSKRTVKHIKGKMQ